MNRLNLIGASLLFSLLLNGCASHSDAPSSKDSNEVKSETSNNDASSEVTSTKEAPVETKELSKNVYTEDNQENKVSNKQKTVTSNEQQSESQKTKSASLKDMERLKETLRTFIFDDYMKNSDYGTAKGVNWSENFYDNLTAEEIWKIIEEYKQANNGQEGTLFDQALYLSTNAPIKDNWKELFLEDWKNSSYSDEEIVELIDKGDTVGVYTKSLPYTGDNYPYVTLDKRTGYWHG